MNLNNINTGRKLIQKVIARQGLKNVVPKPPEKKFAKDPKINQPKR